jgi:hypothetical protein
MTPLRSTACRSNTSSQACVNAARSMSPSSSWQFWIQYTPEPGAMRVCTSMPCCNGVSG